MPDVCTRCYVGGLKSFADTILFIANIKKKTSYSFVIQYSAKSQGMPLQLRAFLIS